MAKVEEVKTQLFQHTWCRVACPVASSGQELGARAAQEPRYDDAVVLFRCRWRMLLVFGPVRSICQGKEHSNSPWNQELRNVVLHDFAGQMLQSVLTSTLLGPGQSDSLAVLRSPEDFAAQFGSRSLENAAVASELASAGFTGFGRQPLWFVTGPDTE